MPIVDRANARPRKDLRSSRQRAYDFLQEKIVRGELPAGAALSELALARELGSSRTPIREAIGQLLAEGFLEQFPNRGTVVVQLSRNDIIDLFELREALETYAVRRAGAKGLQQATLDRVRQALDETARLAGELRKSRKPSLDSEQMQRFMMADLTFHTLLLYSAGNRRIVRVVTDTRLLIRIFAIRHHGHTGEELAEIHRQHRQILDALLNGATEDAAVRLAEHIRRSLQERLNAFDDADRESSFRWTGSPAAPLLPEVSR